MAVVTREMARPLLAAIGGGAVMALAFPPYMSGWLIVPGLALFLSAFAGLAGRAGGRAGRRPSRPSTSR